MKPIRKVIGGLGNIMFKNAYIYAQARRGEIPDVYVQSEKYFKDFADEVKLMYQVDTPTIDYVSLHIRRGDYKDTDFYVDLTETDYYQKAVAMFPNDKFLVFYKDRQDPLVDEKDKAWLKGYLDTLIPGRYEVWEGGTETDDLNAMASCKSNIMANSSFSWWAAYLNPNVKKTVVCPAKWFSDGAMRIDLQEDWVLL